MPLADTRFLQRRRALSAQLAAKRIDAMLVTHLTHIRYLSGFTGSNAALIINKDLSARISTDGRYTTQIAEQVPDIESLMARNCAPALLSDINGAKRVGFEADYLSVSQCEELRKSAGSDVELIPVTGAIEKLRLIKDALEIESLRSVAKIANTAFQELIDDGLIAAGRTERAIAADLEYRMRIKGAERPSFDTIVASGPNSAKPHHGAGDRVICEGDIVTIDFGAYADGYNSDTTRTVIVGQPTAFAREIYSIVLEAQRAGCAAAVPGTSLVDVDKACHEVIENAGYGEYFVHSTGHGLGLDVHEQPAAAVTGSGVLEENMTLTIEPGIYVPGKGGVRIEDSLVIRSGSAENLTSLSKDLLIL